MIRYFTPTEIATARKALSSRLSEQDGAIGIAHLAGAFSFRYVVVYAASVRGCDDVTAAVASLIEAPPMLVHQRRAVAVPVGETDEALAKRISKAARNADDGGQKAPLRTPPTFNPPSGGKLMPWPEGLADGRELVASAPTPARRRGARAGVR